MGSMSEEMKKVVAKWNETLDEIAPIEKEEPQEVHLEPQFKTIRAELLHLIQMNPGITGVQLKDIMCKKHPSQTDAALSSQISSLFKDFYVRREIATHKGNRSTYAYFFNSYEEAKNLRTARRKRVKVLQDRLEKAREVKAQKARQRQEERDRAQMPLPFNAPVPVEPEVVSRTIPLRLDLSGYTPMDILQAINFIQAKEIYKELKGAFSG